ncbi:MAG: Scr1 family TA system antitoxin-like transcriptional regulator [Micromonosporaceae bacterium]
MAEQLAHLEAMSRQPNVSLRVVPLSVLHSGVDCARFTLLRFPTDRRGLGEPPLVYTDVLTGALYLNKPEEIEAYEAMWNGMLEAALSPPESRKLIDDYRKRYQR